MTKHGISTAQDYRTHIFNAIFEDIGMYRSQTAGSGIHIGIVDSVHQPSIWAKNKFDIYSTRTFINSESDQFDISHGMEVFELISQIVPKAKFSFYQVIGSEENTGITPYTNAIDRAISDNVDILNMSFGAPNQIPPEASPYYPPIERVINNDIIPVAAAGNLEYHNGPKKYVYAPANIPSVVAVGGSETLCPRTQASGTVHSAEGPYYFKNDDRNRMFCSNQGCSDGTPCVRNNSTRPWPDNTKPLDGKPDILAPAHFPSNTNTNSLDDVAVKFGTSYSAPIVTGAVARALYEYDLSPQELIPKLQDFLSESGETVDNYPSPKLDVFNFHSRIDAYFD